MNDRAAGWRFLEDFTPGERLDVPGEYEMTPERVHAFASEYDPQKIHLDPAAASGEFFGRLIASGWHSLAATAGMLMRARPLGEGPVVGVAIDGLRFLAPVEPGYVLRVTAEVLDVRPSASRPGQGYLRLRIVTLNQRDEPVLTQEWTLLVPRRAAAEQRPEEGR